MQEFKSNRYGKTMGFSLLTCLAISINSTAADSPRVTGLGGGGRAGVANESLFLNPAAAVLLDGSSSFFHYTKPSVPELGSSGRSLTVGASDGDNPVAKGAAAFVRTSRARVNDGKITYEDRKEFRMSFGQYISGSIAAGISGRYVTRDNGDGTVTKFFQGDLGLLFPLFSDIRAGATFENFSKKNGEEPPTLGLGASYILGAGIQLYADGTQIMAEGPKKGQKSWSLSGEINAVADFVIRASRFRKAFTGAQGNSLGLTWGGPRTSLDYAYRSTKGSPHEKDHVFGLNVKF